MLIAPLLVAFLLCLPHTRRFVDEDTALICGRELVQALVSSDSPTKLHAAHADGLNSIGAIVAVPSGLLMALSGDVLIARLPLAAWAITFWVSEVLFALALLRRVAPEVTTSARTRLLIAAIVLCLVQASPNSYLDQTKVLGEFAAASLLMLAFWALLSDRWKAGAALCGASMMTKINFLMYLPAVLGMTVLLDTSTAAWSARTVLRRLAVATLWFVSAPIALQLLKLVAFGVEGYADGWSAYVDWILHTSGAGFAPLRKGRPVDDFSTYLFLHYAFFAFSVLAPAALTGYLVLKRRIERKLGIALALLAATVLIGFAQWFHADARWWRRAYPFLLPGFGMSLVLGIFLVQQRWGRTRPRLLGFALGGAIAVHAVALSVVLRRPVLSEGARHVFSWERPVSRAD